MRMPDLSQLSFETELRHFVAEGEPDEPADQP
jgi:hypothetical protein